MQVDFVVFGLGNPGSRYAFTRHNIGFIALDILAQESKKKFSDSGLGKKINAEICEVSLAGKNLLLVKPLTFMNLSGESLQKLYQQHNHLRQAGLLCLHDEVDLSLGKVRVKMGGGDAGHNGLKSLRAALGHGDYFRIRMGVGRPPAESNMELADFVLQAFSKSEEEILYREITKSISVLEALVDSGLPKALVVASKEEK